MNKAIKSVLLLLLFAVSCSGDSYLYRSYVWGNSDVDDWRRFPERTIRRGGEIFKFGSGGDAGSIESLSSCEYISRGKKEQIEDLNTFNEKNSSTAFIIIRDDAVLYENYFNGSRRDSVCTSFSVAKSFVSLLIGIASDEGLLKSSDPFVKYIPEMKGKGLDGVTLADLMEMRSPVHYREHLFSWGDDCYTYYYPDLRKLVLTRVKADPEEGKTFWYDNYHPLVLGMVLERATGQSVASYMEKKLWSRIGAEYDAGWSLDSKRSGFEKMESGINARAIDYAKIGRLVLNKGKFRGGSIVSEKWIRESTEPDFSRSRDYYARAWFLKSDVSYKYFWYGYRRGSSFDIFAAGHLGQYIYICPEKKIIIVRCGRDDGKVDSWIDCFYAICSRL